MTRTEYMYAVGINIDDVIEGIADEEFMEAIDRIAVAIGAFESEYCEAEEKH